MSAAEIVRDRRIGLRKAEMRQEGVVDRLLCRAMPDRE